MINAYSMLSDTVDVYRVLCPDCGPTPKGSKGVVFFEARVKFFAVGGYASRYHFWEGKCPTCGEIVNFFNDVGTLQLAIDGGLVDEGPLRGTV